MRDKSSEEQRMEEELVYLHCHDIVFWLRIPMLRLQMIELMGVRVLFEEQSAEFYLIPLTWLTK